MTTPTPDEMIARLAQICHLSEVKLAAAIDAELAKRDALLQQAAGALKYTQEELDYDPSNWNLIKDKTIEALAALKDAGYE